MVTHTLIILKNSQRSRTDNNEKWTLKETLMYFLDNCGTLRLDPVQTFKTSQSEMYISDWECVDAQPDFKINTWWSRTQTWIKTKQNNPLQLKLPCSKSFKTTSPSHKLNPNAKFCWINSVCSLDWPGRGLTWYNLSHGYNLGQTASSCSDYLTTRPSL